MMHKTLIIGIGNSLRGDDGVAEAILSRLDDSILRADTILLHQLTIECAQLVSSFEAVLFVDASLELPPGQWKCEELIDRLTPSVSLSHEMSPQAVLALSRTLYDSGCTAYLLSVGAHKFDALGGISPEVEDVIPQMVDFVCQWSLDQCVCSPESERTGIRFCSRDV